MSLEDDLLRQRLERVQQIEALGFRAYGQRFDFTHRIPAILADRARLSLEANPIDVHRATDAALVQLDHLAQSHPNILFVATRGDARQAQARLEERGILTFALGARRLRFVFHRDAGDDALEAAVAAGRAIFG